ncbi:hypothetical protein [Rhizohabitans arisaemae]|uniref:hypothetical protein n=1 Tax=Rhizohabitans arisaemae TaxID=2720610 RepID=UPI0024B16A7B|nr:hypothetical protein [Rhizohabitans arisaemae]
MTRTTALALGALAAAAVLVGGAPIASAADGSDEKPGLVAPNKAAAAHAAALAPHPQFFGAFVVVPPGQNRVATVSCPAGQVPSGGGGATSGIRIFFTDSFASGNGWVIRGTNTNTANESIRAFVVCTTP